MRLSEHERQQIRDAAHRHFGVAPRLFGSRLDDSRRGGDIDLLVTSALPPDQAVCRKLDLLAELWARLGERKIDVLIDDGSDLPVLRHAREEGVLV